LLRQWFGYQISHCHGRHEGPSVLFYTVNVKEILRPPLEQEIVLGAEEPPSDYFAGRGLKPSDKSLPAGSNLAMTKKWWWLVLEVFVSLAPCAWLGQRQRKSSSTLKNSDPDALGRSVRPPKARLIARRDRWSHPRSPRSHLPAWPTASSWQVLRVPLSEFDMMQSFAPLDGPSKRYTVFTSR